MAHQQSKLTKVSSKPASSVASSVTIRDRESSSGRFRTRERAERVGGTSGIKMEKATDQFTAFKQSVVETGTVERIDRIRKGIDARHIIPISEYFKISREAIGGIIGISPATMNRKIKSHSVLTPVESERLERIAQVEFEAELVFGDPDSAKKWLLQENSALKSQPLAMLDTDIGTKEVRKALNAIAYGGVV